MGEKLATRAHLIRPDIPKGVIRSVSNALRGNLEYCPETVNLFRIAHRWRGAHWLPMRRIRQELKANLQILQMPGVTSARLKRMSSIRKKLKNEPFSLLSIQDIAGCRAILSDIKDVKKLVNFYNSGSISHIIENNRDLISRPRPSGYRSYHIVLRFMGTKSSVAWSKLLIEVQIRTQLQHAWATAVEAVGLMRGENLKAGEGSPDWLRLFALMSADFADEEGLPEVPGTPLSAYERKIEIRELAKSLNAIQVLESYNNAINVVGTSYGGPDRCVTVQFDYSRKTVTVRPFLRSMLTEDTYFTEEAKNDEIHTVIVELNKLDDLQAAYPNYFVDVRMFLDKLKSKVYKFYLQQY